MYMEEVEGFEPPRVVKPLSVFKTDPFSRTWVYLRVTDKNYINMASVTVSTVLKEIHEEICPRKVYPPRGQIGGLYLCGVRPPTIYL
jgi:hypothetical protein